VKYIETIRSLERDKEYNLRKIKKLTSEVKTLQEEKDVVDGKLARLLKSSKDLEGIIKSQRSENVKEGVGYNAVPPPAADLYRSPKKDLSWTGLPEFADDTVTDYSRPTPTVESTSAEGDRPAERQTTNKAEFVKAAERPTTDKVETTKNPAVRYAEMYRRPSKKLTVRGNQRNWNNLKKKVQKETTRSQNHAYKSSSQRSYGAPMRPSHRPAGHRPHGPLMRPQYRAPWVPTVNRDFLLVNRKLPTGQLKGIIGRCSEDKKKQRNKET
nr:hypothetical protein [Tanacetum cinerariifolium]